MDSLWKILELVVGFTSPIAVAWFTLRLERERKENARIKELEKEAQARKDADIQKQFSEINNALTQLTTKVSEVAETVEGLEDVDEKYGAMLKTLQKQHRLNWQYTHELVILVMTLAAGLRDQHLDGNITKAIARCQDFEHAALSEIMTGTKHDDE